MPKRTDAPGLKRGRVLKDGTPLWYWIASQVARDLRDFPDKCIRLPDDADEARRAELCREHTARLEAWLDQARKGENPKLPRYDGSVYSASQIYQKHPLSRFKRVKANTRRFYAAQCEIIERTVGKRLIRNVTVPDVEYWYTEWRKPAPQDDPDAPPGPERIDRAHDCVSMLRTILRFCAALRHKDCKQLADELEEVRFEKGGAREGELTYEHAVAFLRTASELGGRGIIPPWKALYMSIGVAAQFELLLRQKDIIGEWPATAADLEAAVRRGAARHDYNGEAWVGYFTWERIPGWRWRTKTSKSKYRAARDFDLTQHSMLFPLLEQVPHEERTGAIVKGEGDLPARESTYRKWFREIADPAGIPKAVWLMDSRAGGGGEAYDAGAALEDIQGAYTHTKPDQTLRYIRRSGKRLANVAVARKRAREQGGG
jgi:hypothetical protein